MDINLETNEEEEFEVILVEEEDVEMDIETQGVHPITQLPSNVPLWKG